jgi:predicted alpha-1,2-mannosidase
MKMGYVPEDKSGSSVSKTLEYAYDDWAIAQIAGKIPAIFISGENPERFVERSVFNEFMKRSENYKNVFDPVSGFMRPKLSDGTFRQEFDPLNTHGQGFIEGNAWNYGLYIPQNIGKMIEMMGGKKRFSGMLDSLYTLQLSDEHIQANEDITRDGIIGLYVHGNEPGHHIPYLYNWTGKPWKTQERVRMINKTMYADAPNGLCGNDDCGQMSAWYIFSALGFYPVCPGSPEYAIGSPMVKSALVDLGDGKTLQISTENQSPENVYVKKVLLDGREIRNFSLNHFDLMKGDELKFVMGRKPKIQK